MFRSLLVAGSIAVAIALTAASPRLASAAPVIITGDGSLGDFWATLSYSSSSATAGTLSVAMSNLVTTLPGGHITAFVFNAPTGAISVTGVTQGATFGANFGLLNGIQNGINGQPFGLFDIGASTGGSFQGGGNPNVGIPVEGLANFDFDLTGIGLDVSEDAFLAALINTLSSPRGVSDLASFVVRFRGFDNGDSEKVPGGPPKGGPPVPPPVIDHLPEPASVLIWSLLAAAGVAARFRRRR
jgi:hypothetical protein